jgi:hypothetical protein
VIDDHGHPFARSGGPWDIASIGLFTEVGTDADQRRQEVGGKRLWAHLMDQRLARYLKCNVADLPEARNEASADWPTYVRGLLDDAGIVESIFDVGAERDSTVSDYYADLTGRPVHWLGRIDPVIDNLMEVGADAETIVSEVERFCREAISAGCAGFKTAMAYRTGLSVRANMTIDQAQESLVEDVAIRRRGKACRDLAFQRALGIAAESGHPFQVHTGFGDSSLRLSESNPLLLEEILGTEEGSSAPIVLIHSGYPWTEELGFLAMSKPNVFAEVSLINIFTPLKVTERILQLLELVSTDRIIFGTDGHEQPETFWYAAHALRQSWEEVGQELGRVGASTSWIEQAHHDLFEGNARRLYLD